MTSKAETVRRSGRVELNAISGARWFATTSLVFAHAIESLWLADGGECEWFRRDTCVVFKRISKDFVCFYLVLAGFVMTWGYMGRDYDTWEEKGAFWKRRLARFYPDYFIAMVLGTCLKHQYFLGCHDMSVESMIWNILGLTLIPSWFYALGPGYANGPAWFMGTLFWLWMLYPFVIKHARRLFPADDSAAVFVAKLFGVWIVAVVPFAIVALLSPNSPVAESSVMQDWYTQSGVASYAIFWQKIRWTVKAFPLCRMAEFVIGIGLALRVKGRSEYVQIDSGGESEKAGGEDDKTVAYLPMIATFIVVVYEIVQNATWDSGRCNCLNDDFVGCYGWFEVLDNKFALMSAAVIYGVATLDVRFAATGAGEGEGESEAFKAQVGWAGSTLHKFLTFPFFVTVGQWGLQLYLYQMIAYFLFQGILVGLTVMDNRCSMQYMPWWGQILYVAGELSLLYTIVYFMNPKGIIGSEIIKLVDKYFLGKSSD